MASVGMTFENFSMDGYSSSQSEEDTKRTKIRITYFNKKKELLFKVRRKKGAAKGQPLSSAHQPLH